MVSDIFQRFLNFGIIVSLYSVDIWQLVNALSFVEQATMCGSIKQVCYNEPCDRLCPAPIQ